MVLTAIPLFSDSSSCVNPFEIKTSVAIEASTNIAQVFEGQGGANVDPSKIQGCIGAQLEAAYKKIAGEYKNLSGYTANAANAELKKISNAAAAAEAEAKKQAEAAEREYNKAVIRTRIQEIDNALVQLATVKAPYPGTVKRLKWQGQDDRLLNVELTVDVHPERS